MSTISVTVTGLSEVQDRLKTLSGRDATKALRSGMLRATRPILDQAKQNLARIEHGSGALHHSLRQVFVVGHDNQYVQALPPMGGRFTVRIGPRIKDSTAIALYRMFYKRYIGGIYYGLMLERGWTTTRGTVVPPHAFLLPALRAGQSAAVGVLADEINAAIARLLKAKAKPRRTTKRKAKAKR